MSFRILRLALGVAGTAVTLAACTPDRVVTGSTYPTDYRDRHPIVLARSAETLDVFVSGAALDPRQEDDLRSFAATYRRYGQGPVTAQVPSGPRAGAAARRALPVIRSILADSGVPAGAVTVASYPVTDPALAAPVRLSFPRLKAEVESRCGLWPQDLGVSDVKSNAGNDPYWNLGCAMQTNVAAQVADPIDLVRGRAEGRVDTVRRSANIDKVRGAQDPSTRYTTQTTTIGNVGK
jgi:pilus assembly protein CpaD